MAPPEQLQELVCGEGQRGGVQLDAGLAGAPCLEGRQLFILFFYYICSNQDQCPPITYILFLQEPRPAPVLPPIGNPDIPPRGTSRRAVAAVKPCKVRLEKIEKVSATGQGG